MGYWVKHPKKEGEALLQLIHEHGWKIINPRKMYYKTRCPCGQHSETVHSSPHGNYWLDKRKQFERTPCWKKEETP